MSQVLSTTSLKILADLQFFKHADVYYEVLVTYFCASKTSGSVSLFSAPVYK